MTTDEMLRLYPRETLRWLGRRLGLTQLTLATLAEVAPTTPEKWERGQNAIGRVRNRRRLAALLASHLATPEGEAFARSLGRGEARDA